ncbi:MAG: methylcobamide--CoM methyltransferase MtbA [Kosmotoga sp.]|nr:MAG: methylcobamide--CoM methyltransferase MtbA [Kosmotoga sp.]
MSKTTSMDRVLTTLSHKEPDRVPMFLLLTMHGAKELGMSLKEYYSKAKNVVEGQKMLLNKYNNDCLFPFFYASVETEAMGGEVIYYDDGPPNSGEPIIKKPEDIDSLEMPDFSRAPSLIKVLEATEALKEYSKNEVPLINVVMSPFSIPVMQMGFEGYLELMMENEEYFWKLMDFNIEFCVNWANLQLKAGATAICYFDPVSSTTIITRDQYIQKGFQVAQKTISRINGPTATHFASGRCLPIIDLLPETGTGGIGVSCLEDLEEIKSKAKDKLAVFGNLNAIEMVRWTKKQAENKVKEAIEKAAPGGGFILSDNHGEIPFYVKEETLLSISEAVKKYGRYPLNND